MKWPCPCWRLQIQTCVSPSNIVPGSLPGRGLLSGVSAGFFHNLSKDMQPGREQDGVVGLCYASQLTLIFALKILI